MERLITHLCLLAGDAAMMAAAENVLDAIEAVNVLGSLGAVAAVVVIVTGTAVVLLAWLLN